MSRRARVRPWVLVVAAVVLSALAAPAHADPRDDAKKHFQTGKKHHDAGEWDAALEEYLAAYQLDPSPAFLFNLGQVYRLKGDRVKAVDYYRRYLEAAPEGKGSEEARLYATRLQGELDAEAAAARAKAELEARRAAADASHARDEELARQGRLEDDRRNAEAARAAAASQRQRAERRLRIAGIATAAAGVLGIGLGIKFGLDAKDRERQVSDQNLTQWSTSLDAAVDDGESKSLAMGISVAVGAVLVAAGGVLLGLGWQTREPAAGARPTVGPGPGHAGAGLGWEF